MDLVRVGDRHKSSIVDTIEEMLSMRRQGHSGEVAKRFGIDRTFISRLENLGSEEGKTIALVAFPVKIQTN